MAKEGVAEQEQLSKDRKELRELGMTTAVPGKAGAKVLNWK